MKVSIWSKLRCAFFGHDQGGTKRHDYAPNNFGYYGFQCKRCFKWAPRRETSMSEWLKVKDFPKEKGWA